MSDLFKSAFEYFSGPGNGQNENSFVGQIVEISNVKLKIKNVIAEGGYAIVFVAQDVATGKEYALKRLLAADEEAKKNIIQEINILKKVSGHPNIIRYLSASFIDKSQTQHGQSEFLLVTELCSGGSLVEILQARTSPFDCDVITRIFYQTCRAVAHMHSQVPPIIHRDLKIENLLISDDGTIKLCDFGSATVEIFKPDLTWSANQHTSLEDTQWLEICQLNTNDDVTGLRICARNFHDQDSIRGTWQRIKYNAIPSKNEVTPKSIEAYHIKVSLENETTPQHKNKNEIPSTLRLCDMQVDEINIKDMDTPVFGHDKVELVTDTPSSTHSSRKRPYAEPRYVCLAYS